MSSSRSVIKVEKMSKLYRLGQVSTGSVSHDLNRWWAGLRGKEDPYLKIGEKNDRLKKGDSEYVWALKDINFEVQQGDILGIIGKNGAGKSTLLKLLSRTTSPTQGSIKVKGRIASLLEVGTGFHPELTGRENIFLNGAILGMNKTEIKRKFDQIVDFAGVERYIDTPVKRYSSGMYVRLAFAVAAHLESEILVIDEVLAVGDLEFQKKCMGKMGDVASEDGKTILFVSHNMQAIQKMCNKGLLLKNGLLSSQGSMDKIIQEYLSDASPNQANVEIDNGQSKELMPGYAMNIQIIDEQQQLIPEIPVGKPWSIKVRYQINTSLESFVFAIGISTELDVAIRTVFTEAHKVLPGQYEAVLSYTDILLSSGKYNLAIGLSNYEKTFAYYPDVACVWISDISDIRNEKIIKTKATGLIINPLNIYVTKIS
ncbi:MAG: ABC-type polysaccharide/polyol phosphate transport system, ATPase component [Chitinophagaceae bacterium]|nr:ABC-type polysaccharide/polyol phosphate transport system, ATPase component [Chitinophagaceae bacterium]